MFINLFWGNRQYFWSVGSDVDHLGECVCAISRKGETGEGEGTAQDGERDPGGFGEGFDLAGAPGIASGPEEGAVLGSEGHGLLHGGVVEAGEGEGRGPGDHGAGVVVAAFGLVEGASFLAVVAVADVFDTAEAVLGLAFVEHADGGGVFEAGHNFGEVREGVFRTVFGIAGH